ncbi:patatin family protein [Photobacterium carnosum]|uniref:patatin-like phospholipase family protein n=1 Tax=Photobacterium carnosum TaxID=2023717 RepID=UPI00128B7DE1|nr:patatin family protein [Photobacterium carnosum]KAE8178291.1 patatin family protein [Photobacterium carnosum]MCD9514461.1 patatin family protein [Photobacterium carnosum]MCD9537904.1 patatin family protein [Photobacterium carnosum]MCF2162487.1 patatin family protein [Photobacterium carnosum]
MNYLPFSLRDFNEKSVADFSLMLNTTSNKKIALIVQGGGQRGIFSAGVLDSFLDHQFDPFELYIGTSAGALNLSSFISRQPRFGYHFIRDVSMDDKFFNLYKYLSKQQPMNLEWALQQVSSSGLYPLDVATAHKTLMCRTALACATRKDTLQDYYLPMYQQDWQDVLLASCAIPLLYNQPVNMDELQWVDGGVSAAIPVKEAWRRGADLVVVIRTEPLEYSDTDSSDNNGRGIFDDWRENIEIQLPYYIDKLSLNESVDKIKNIHQELSQRFEQWRQHYWNDETNDSQDTELVNKSISKKGWFSQLNVERLIALTGQGTNSEILEMLARYHHTYRDVNDFLVNPPQGLQVIQIAPEKALNSSALLSSYEDLELDYQQGKQIGEQFVTSFSQLLNQKTSLMQHLR